jgi:hypothetical protein
LIEAPALFFRDCSIGVAKTWVRSFAATHEKASRS